MIIAVTRSAAGLLIAAMIAVIGTSQAATLGTLSKGSLAAGTVSNPALCTVGAMSVTTQVGYRGGRYEIYQLTFTAIPSNCQGKTFIAKIADRTTNASLGTVTGTLPAGAAGPVAVTTGTDPNLNNVTSTVKVVLYVAG